MLDNKKLLLLLAVLAGLFLLVRWMKADKNVRTFNADLFKMDTSAVAAIKLYTKAENHEEILFKKNGDQWTVSKGAIQSVVPEGHVKGLLSSLVSIKPQRLAARTRDKWSKYEVNDSLGTRVVVEDAGGKKMADLMVGKFSYRQPKGGQPNFGGQQQISGLTYIRSTDAEETFATEGFLSMTFNRDFNSFRNKLLMTCDPEMVRRVQMQSPAGGYTLSKPGNEWLLDGSPADSTTVMKFINGLRNVTGSAIDDHFTPSGNGAYSLTLSGDNMTEIKVNAYAKGEGFRLTSSLNPDTVIESDSSGVFGRLFEEGLSFLGE